jgi:hypothetical protein
MRRFCVEAVEVHHGIGSQDLASGNVWAEGILRAGTLDAHRGMPFDNLRTNLAIRPGGRGGGAGFGGPLQGRRNVNWNIACLPGEKPPRQGSLVMIACPDAFSRGAIIGLRGQAPFRAEKTRPPMPLGDPATVVDPVPQGVWPLDVHAAQVGLRQSLTQGSAR